MKAKILLRIAAILMLLHTLGHSIGALTWKDAPNAAIKQVVDGMLNNHFDFFGKSVSIGDFYAGYGYSMIGVLLMVSILLWFLSTEPVRRMVLAMGLFLLFLAVIEFIYFFPLPAVLSLLAGVATMLAYGRIKAIIPSTPL
jgi:hypothetical protein